MTTQSGTVSRSKFRLRHIIQWSLILYLPYLWWSDRSTLLQRDAKQRLPMEYRVARLVKSHTRQRRDIERIPAATDYQATKIQANCSKCKQKSADGLPFDMWYTWGGWWYCPKCAKNYGIDLDKQSDVAFRPE